MAELPADLVYRWGGFFRWVELQIDELSQRGDLRIGLLATFIDRCFAGEESKLQPEAFLLSGREALAAAKPTETRREKQKRRRRQADAEAANVKRWAAAYNAKRGT